ncbi:MAG: PBP1A family penicillin-binding protein [Alphaproteobacteria bacterium]|nr:PBP1A family penicillin-binding protein [Alphaproteobacteria bacterium]
MAKKKKPRKKRKSKKKQSLALLFARLGLLAGIWTGVAVFFYILYCAVDLPDVHQATQPPLRPSVELEAKDGTVFARYGDLVGEPVVLSSLPDYVPEAILAIEDRRFYDHFGIDIFGIARAMARNLMAGHTVQGGSTLTQQLAKNLFLTPKRAIKRKVQEMLLALWLEHEYTKDQILTAYLNRVYLGSGAYGIDAAAQTYFNKSARELNIREAALIAGLLRAPSRYSPLHDPVQAFERSKIVMRAMVEEGYITEDQQRDAVATAPKIERKITSGNSERYFADWVYDKLGPLISDTRQDMVVRTTLDISLERLAEKHVQDILSKQGQAKNVTEAALVTLAPNGEVRALTGGRSYRTSQYNRATQSHRQPGSAFKPIVYLTAIEQGLTPDELIRDEPFRIGGYSPENYDGKYRGAITARTALAQSINTVAVRLLDRAGIGKVIETAKDLGIASPLKRNAALALGASEVTPLELAAAYASIASGGRAIEPYAIAQIRTRSGKLIYRHPDVRPPQVKDADAVATLTDMMKDVLLYGTGKTAKLGTRPAAGKTGTTSDYRDAWFAGFTADYTTVVWMGNDDNAPMKKVTGGSLPALLWHNYMLEAEANLPEEGLKSNSIAEQFLDAAGAVTEDVSKAFSSFIDSILGGEAP